jgi:iron-sulfur cluster assembly accessory protein
MQNDSIDLDQLLERAAPGPSTGRAGEADDETRSRSPVVAEEASTSLRLTPKAVKMVKLTRDEEGIDPAFGLRVAVRGGGCSGFEYALDFENEQRPNDEVIEYEGLRVYVDPISSRYLAGTTIDYALGVSGTGFKFDNPRATGTCGCGSSFAV